MDGVERRAGGMIVLPRWQVSWRRFPQPKPWPKPGLFLSLLLQSRNTRRPQVVINWMTLAPLNRPTNGRRSLRSPGTSPRRGFFLELSLIPGQCPTAASRRLATQLPGIGMPPFLAT